MDVDFVHKESPKGKGHTWAKGSGATKQANSVGETEKTGDMNWIMMIQQVSDGQTITSGHETSRCCGTSVRPKSVNPVILSSTAKLVVDSGCFDHCCPLEFATLFELNEGRFLNASAANTIKLKNCGTRVVEGWTRDVNDAEMPLKIRFNVFDVQSPLLSTCKL